jgi:hypothetical protein
LEDKPQVFEFVKIDQNQILGKDLGTGAGCHLANRDRNRSLWCQQGATPQSDFFEAKDSASGGKPLRCLLRF